METTCQDYLSGGKGVKEGFRDLVTGRIVYLLRGTGAPGHNGRYIYRDREDLRALLSNPLPRT